jgi:hypothetical protein
MSNTIWIQSIWTSLLFWKSLPKIRFLIEERNIRELTKDTVVTEKSYSTCNTHMPFGCLTYNDCLKWFGRPIFCLWAYLMMGNTCVWLLLSNLPATAIYFFRNAQLLVCVDEIQYVYHCSRRVWWMEVHVGKRIISKKSISIVVVFYAVSSCCARDQTQVLRIKQHVEWWSRPS